MTGRSGRSFLVGEDLNQHCILTFEILRETVDSEGNSGTDITYINLSTLLLSLLTVSLIDGTS